MNSFKLVWSQDSQIFVPQILFARFFFDITRIILEIWILRQCDIISFDFFICQSLIVRFEVLSVLQRLLCWEFGDNFGVASFQIPKVMEISVRKDNEASVFSVSVFS